MVLGTAPASATDPACPAGKAAVTEQHYLINGTTATDTLQGVLMPGDHLKVTFTVADGCTQAEVSLASYRAPDADFANNKTQQELSDSDTGFFNAGVHTLEVDVATCFFQTDFAVGHVIQELGRPEYYGPRLIDSADGGTTCVESSPSPSPTGSVEATSSPSAPSSDAPTSSPTQEVHGVSNELPAAGQGGTDVATGLAAFLLVMTGIAVLSETRRRGILSMALANPRSPAPTSGGGGAVPASAPEPPADQAAAETIAAEPVADEAPVEAMAPVAAPMKVEIVEAERAEDIDPMGRGRQVAIVGMGLLVAGIAVAVLARRRGGS
jgi:hypothetical protein